MPAFIDEECFKARSKPVCMCRLASSFDSLVPADKGPDEAMGGRSVTGACLQAHSLLNGYTGRLGSSSVHNPVGTSTS
jgi:hypothetical protein